MPVKIRQLISRSPTQWVKGWLRVLGPPFIALTIVVSLLGAAIVSRNAHLDLRLWILSALSLVLIHFGTSSLNDYFDFRSGTDNINQTPTPLSGGSRVIQEGMLSPQALLAGGSLFIAIGSSIGIYLAMLKGWPIFLLGIIGVFLAVGYVHPKVNLSKRGLGEFAVAVSFGPIMLSGVYYVQTQAVDLNVILIGCLMGLLAGCTLWINEIPDYEADKTTGKTNWVVRLGKKKASYVYVAWLFLIYFFSLILITNNILPKFSWIVLATLIFSIRSARVALRNYNEVEKLLPANALTIALTLTYGILLTIAFLIPQS
ncbi:prenyltransferase [bacterium]|nr:MAG: prenyltransferase [bacterium]